MSTMWRLGASGDGLTSIATDHQCPFRSGECDERPCEYGSHGKKRVRVRCEYEVNESKCDIRDPPHNKRRRLFTSRVPTPAPTLNSPSSPPEAAPHLSTSPSHSPDTRCSTPELSPSSSAPRPNGMRLFSRSPCRNGCVKNVPSPATYAPEPHLARVAAPRPKSSWLRLQLPQ